MKKLQTVNVQRVPKVAKKMDFREEGKSAMSQDNDSSVH